MDNLPAHVNKSIARFKGMIKQATPSMLKNCGHNVELQERLEQAALTSLINNDYLRKCAEADPTSFIVALKDAADARLDIGGVRRHGALVPFKNSVKFVPQYQGYIHLMTTGEGAVCRSVDSQCVYENDTFEYEVGIDGTKLRHVPMIKGDRGKLVAAYAIAHLKEGGAVVEVMNWHEIEAVKSRSASVKSGKQSPWDTDYDAMARKCPIRRISKFVPMTKGIEKVHKIEDRHDGVIDIEDYVLEDAPTETKVKKAPVRKPKLKKVDAPKNTVPERPPEPPRTHTETWEKNKPAPQPRPGGLASAPAPVAEKVAQLAEETFIPNEPEPRVIGDVTAGIIADIEQMLPHLQPEDIKNLNESFPGFNYKNPPNEELLKDYHFSVSVAAGGD